MSALAETATVVVDSADPPALAEFYRKMTGLDVTSRDEDFVSLGGSGAVQLAFQRVPGYRAPAWPEGGAHVHLDLTVTDVDAATRDLVALGAAVAEFQPGAGAWVVLTDPEGHPFCLAARD
jgi:predicted enzyme related to lactoylglutathione lyase